MFLQRISTARNLRGFEFVTLRTRLTKGYDEVQGVTKQSGRKKQNAEVLLRGMLDKSEGGPEEETAGFRELSNICKAMTLRTREIKGGDLSVLVHREAA